MLSHVAEVVIGLTSFLPCWQPYIVQISDDQGGLQKGFESTRCPEGIPSMAEYLADYCSSAVISISS